MTKNNLRGFTLIELSIVLVIIGLLVGGILVGRELIETARIRKTVGAIQEINVAVNTFRLKYHCYPGDCTNALILGVVAPSYSGWVGTTAGDGNGYLEATRELPLLLLNLVNAKLVNVTFYTDPALPSDHYLNFRRIILPLQEVEFRFDLDNRTIPPYNLVHDISGYCDTAFAGCLTPARAYAIDYKLDDGKPTTGITRARSGYNFDPADIANAALYSTISGLDISPCIDDHTATDAHYYFLTTTPMCGLYTTINDIKVD